MDTENTVISCSTIQDVSIIVGDPSLPTRSALHILMLLRETLSLRDTAVLPGAYTHQRVGEVNAT